MKQLLKSTETLMHEEYARASAKFGAVNNSDHESYGVIKEEVDEAKAEFAAMKYLFGRFWKKTKSNAPSTVKRLYLSRLQMCALRAAAECIQVAAMAHKAILTLGGNEK